MSAIGGLAARFAAIARREAVMAIPQAMAEARTYVPLAKSADPAVNAQRRLLNTIGSERAQAARMGAMGYVLEDLIKYASQNGPWTDRTTNLRRSYRSEIIQPTRDSVRGFFANIANYAPYIEFKAGYWVLSGAMRARLDVISMLLAREIREGTEANRLGTGTPKGLYEKARIAERRKADRQRRIDGRLGWGGEQGHRRRGARGYARGRGKK